MTTFILIHGGFHGGWCWERVAPLLEAAGHAVIAPDLPGMGNDPTPHDRITLASTADFVTSLAQKQPGPVVLVGHSLGGLVLGEVAERIPGKIEGLVYITPALVLQEMTAQQGAQLSAHHAMTPTADGHSMTYDPARAAEIFYNTTDAVSLANAVSRLRPQPIAPMKGRPVTTSESRFGRVPRAFIECTEDRAIPLAVQRQMQVALPCDPVFTLESDHSPFLSVPRELADCFLAAAAKFGSR
jgi:pimeloyl-ACP methyl ester carboxylesterase